MNISYSGLVNGGLNQWDWPLLRGSRLDKSKDAAMVNLPTFLLNWAQLGAAEIHSPVFE